MKKLACLFALAICGLNIAAQTKIIQGKYCEDLGFGWYCITFQKNGTYIIQGGHSHHKSKDTGTWTLRNDTIITVRSPKIKTEDSDIEMYLFTDSLYSVYFNHATKQFVRGKALTKN